MSPVPDAAPAATTRVAAWQCPPGPPDIADEERVAGNLRRLDGACTEAAARGAEVLVTPEMFTSGYGIAPDAVTRLAEAPGGPAETAVADIARRHGLAIAYGHPSRAPGGGTYNAATLVGPDGVVRGRHRKVHLFGEMDRRLFVPSPQPPAPFDLGGTRVGMLICYDVEFPEAVRHLAVGGARAVLVPTANMKGYEEVQEFLVRARACENGCGVVYANYCGTDEVFEYGGLSLICGPGGEVLAQAGASGEELLVADLPHQPTGTPANYLADRRPDLYHRLNFFPNGSLRLPRYQEKGRVYGQTTAVRGLNSSFVQLLTGRAGDSRILSVLNRSQTIQGERQRLV